MGHNNKNSYSNMYTNVGKTCQVLSLGRKFMPYEESAARSFMVQCPQQIQSE